MARRVLFVCTQNSCRSQMAEGWLSSMNDGYFEVFSAGTKATFVNPFTQIVMLEAGVDISRQYSKTIDELGQKEFDFVIAVCDAAHDACPNLRGTVATLHWSIEDPAKGQGSRQVKLDKFRRIRDEIHSLIKDFIQNQVRYLK